MQRGTRMPFDRFNDREHLATPTRLAVQFGGPADFTKTDDLDARECRFDYEVTIGGGASTQVESEILHYWPNGTTKKVKLFRRDAKGNISSGKDFDLGGFRQALEKVLRPDASVISTLAQLEHPFSTYLWNTTANILTNILVERMETSDDATVRHYASNPGLVEVFNKEIGRIDLGIQSMEVRQGPNGPVAFFTHAGLEFPMPMVYESHGTRQFIRMYPYILHALETGGIAILDELDSTIHPMLLPEILRWFYDPSRNPSNGQLWMSCQNATLLEDLTKEEVWFCDKNNEGCTQIYGLHDIEDLDNTTDYYRKYLGGAFGAVPQIG